MVASAAAMLKVDRAVCFTLDHRLELTEEVSKSSVLGEYEQAIGRVCVWEFAEDPQVGAFVSS